MGAFKMPSVSSRGRPVFTPERAADHSLNLDRGPGR